jgi:hypothetical protein
MNNLLEEDENELEDEKDVVEVGDKNESVVANQAHLSGEIFFAENTNGNVVSKEPQLGGLLINSGNGLKSETCI